MSVGPYDYERFHSAFKGTGEYRTPPTRRALLDRMMGGTRYWYYAKLTRIVFSANHLAKAGRYTRVAWGWHAMATLGAAENCGCVVTVTGGRNLLDHPGPRVFVANHMSMSETFILPGIMLPYTDVCTVIKESLIRYPVFGIVMQATVPIVVQRADPRADLKEVLTSGEAMLRSGRSVLIFPQATRSVEFIPAEFNSLGAKLAAKGGVPLSPVALRTDYHGIGRRFRDFGPVDMTRPAHFAFGAPIPVVGNGRAAHEQAVTFIREKVKEWGVPVREKKVESPVTSPT